ncbi:MAG: DUF1573 domain-containing protein [Marinifilaceae bacterium]
MKKLLLLLALFGTLHVSAQEAMEFTGRIHDFGKLSPKEGIVEHTFHYKNMTDKPIIIKDILTSCGCTTPEWTKTPVLPNTYGKITVKFNPKNRTGSFKKSIQIITNVTKKNPILLVQGEIIPEFVRDRMLIYPRPPFISPSFNYMEPVYLIYSSWPQLKETMMATNWKTISNVRLTVR